MHPSTIEVLAEPGRADRFLALPHHKVATIGFVRDGRRVAVADFGGLGLRYPYIAFVPQWELEIRVNRLRRWHAPGLLLLGDAAHAMSPIGGVGVNLAVQDAVAAANLLTEPLRRAQLNGEPVPEFQRLAQHFGIVRVPARVTPRTEP